MSRHQYSIVVSSETDARKKASIFSVSKTRVVVLVFILAIIVAAAAVFAVFSAAHIKAQTGELNELRLQAEELGIDFD